MANQTSKPEAALGANNVLAAAYNAADKSITTSSFLVGRVGHKITKTDFDSVTEDYSYYDGVTLLYTIRVVYATSAKEAFVSAERIA